MSLLENGYGLVALVLAAGLAIAVLTLVLGTIERLTARGGRLDDALIDDSDRTTDPAEAERLLRQALMIRERDFGRAHPKTARCRLLLSRRVVGTLVVAVQSHLARGRKDEARRILAEALAAEEAIAYEGPETMGLLKQLAFVTKELRGAAAARPLLERILRATEERAGFMTSETASVLMDVAHARWDCGDFRAAHEGYSRVLKFRVARGRPFEVHPDGVRLCLALLDVALGRIADGHREMQRLEGVFAKAGGPECPTAVLTMGIRVGVLAALDLLADAEQLGGRVVAIRRADPDEPEKLFEALTMLGAVLSHRGRFDEADAAFAEAGAALSRTAAPLPGSRPMWLDARGDSLSIRRRHAEAVPLLEEAVAEARRVYPPGHPEIARMLNNHAEALIGLGRLDEAEDANRRAANIRRRQLDPDHPDLAWTLWNEGEIHRRRGRIAEAEAALRVSLKLRERTLGPDHRDTAAALHALGALLAEGERRDEARALLTRALEIRRKSPGPDHPHTAETAALLEGLGTA